MKTIQLNDIHEQLGAKIVPFAGFCNAGAIRRR